MRRGDLLFVYGTLMRGQRMDMIASDSIKHDILYIGPDLINGNLFHIGSYPGLKTQPVEFNRLLPVVLGEVYMIKDASVTSFLDAYEGYVAEAPDKGLFNRIQTQTEKRRNVWVYTYNGIVRDEQFIETGDWRNPRMCCQHNKLQVRE